MHMHYTVCYALQRGKSLEVSCEPTILHNISKAAHCNVLKRNQVIGRVNYETIMEPNKEQFHMFSQHHQHQQGLSETKTQILF